MPATTFLGADAPLRDAAAVLLGLPYDGGASFRRGAAGGPEAIRVMADSLETFSPATGRDLEEVSLHDAGDLFLQGLTPTEVMERIAGAVGECAGPGRLLVCIGGDHSVSIGVARGLTQVYPALGHLVIDAHHDLRPDYDGSPYSHACGTRRMAETGPTVLLGVRSGTRAEWERDAPHLLAASSTDLSLPAAGREALGGRPVHLSVDLDVLDPSVLPGTGNPEPGGVGYRELWEAIRECCRTLQVVAIDLVEVAPALDPAGVSAVTAAKLARDLICLIPGR